jgi:CAAX protease family protein
MSDGGDAPERTDRPLSFLAAAGWTLLFAILWAVEAEILEAVHPGAKGDLVTFTVSRLLAVSVVLFLILRVHEPETPVRQVLALRRPPVLFTGLAVLAGVGLAIPASFVDDVFLRRYPRTPEELELLDQLGAAGTPVKYAFLVLASVLVLPAIEEVFFHGALFTPLKRGRRADWVVLATSAYAAITFADQRTVASFLGLFLVVGAIRALGGSLWPALAARIAFSAASSLPDLLGRPEAHLASTREDVLTGLLVTAAAMSALVVVARRDARAEQLRLLDG